MKKIIVFLFLVSVQSMFAQRPASQIERRPAMDELSFPNDSVKKNSKSSNKIDKKREAKITDYLIISHVADTTYVDTTLTVAKDYKYNYLRKDNFELQQFSNLGQTYNTLGYDFSSMRLMPQFGARSKHFNYMEVEDVNYYHVPTPLSELFYKSAFKQGQLLDAFFTTNTSKQFNISIAYKGLRSLGTYQHILSSTGNFRTTASYQSKNKRYVAHAHFLSQDILNQENGGLTDESLGFFQSGDKDFLDRGVLEVNFQDAEGVLKGKRTYLNHYYHLIKKQDSVSYNNVSVGHIFKLKDKNYRFTQSTENDFFGDAAYSRNLIDFVKLEELYNEASITYSNNVIGTLKIFGAHTDYNYGYDKLIIQQNQTITNRLKGDVFSVGGKYNKRINRFNIKTEAGANVSGEFNGNYFLAKVDYKLNEDILLKAAINNNTVAPNYNAQLYQSSYLNYNWLNKFNTIKTQQVDAEVISKKWANVKLQASTINDYVYFMKNTTSEQIEALQNDKSISYLKLKINKDIRYRHLGLETTIQYQKVNDKNEIFNVPELITRSTLYYENFAFKKALYFQTGFTASYFTEYYMNNYNPLLSEFYVQRDVEVGGFPKIDFFINAKLRQARIYLKAEHFNAAFTGRDYLTAPNYPYRDFSVRFGLVWNFFM
ncbi:putative porin [Aurantibacter sp.]|uniref:putative porin n=1 Tax=Aurantibacter sp. TaxID=2807103 RepID=UPI0035C7EC35